MVVITMQIGDDEGQQE